MKDAAYKFISFAASPESNAIWFSGTGYMPINKHTAEQDLAKEALDKQPRYRYCDQPARLCPWSSASAGGDLGCVPANTASGKPWLWGQRDVKDVLSEFATKTREEAARLAK